MTTYRLEYYLGRLPQDVDANDLDWHRMPASAGVDYMSLESCLDQAGMLDAGTEFTITHRVVEVEPEVIDQWDARNLRWVKVESYRRLRVA